ncbi:sentrin/SUMO-specific protease SENP1 [Encephalitozoon cuniculi]|nr:sentrin/SUMO-specific protease SENP1 [Encephalitozoon cuniculi]
MDSEELREENPHATGGGHGSILDTVPSRQSQLDAVAEACLEVSTAVKREGYELLPEDIRRMRDGSLLNDKIINVYFELLAKHSKATVYVFSTFFYTTLSRRGVEWVQRWTSGINIFENRLIYIPVHIPGHWMLMVFDVREMVLEHYDSMGNVYRDVARGVSGYLRDEWRRIHGKDPLISIRLKRKIPLQRNGKDCGVFVCMFGRYRLCGDREWLSSDDIPRFRKMMLHEIMSSRILYRTFHLFA